MPLPEGIEVEQLAARLAFIGLDPEALGQLRAISPSIKRHLPQALTAFYGKLSERPEVRRFFSGTDQMKRAENSQSGHWEAIAEGRLDAAYLEKTRKVGLRHANIGLEPRWYIGGYGLILDRLLTGVLTDLLTAQTEGQRRGLFAKAEPKVDVEAIAAALSAMVRAVLVDIELAVTVYFDKITADAAERDSAAKRKIEQAVALTGDTLKQLATGDLTARVTAEFDAEFQQIKDDVNEVAQRFEHMIGRLVETSGALKTATAEILTGANDLAERTTRQAAAIEETSAAMEQLAATIAESATRAAALNAGATKTAESAEESGGVMRNATEAMDRISQSSSRISNIIGLIDDVAFQTNLLALNASVEAARAGEAGKGFAVVAIEVRRLAQSAAEASAEVKLLIEQSGSEIAAGNKLVSEAAEKIETMLAAIRRNADDLDSMAQQSLVQATSVDEVRAAINQMDEMTQHNAALVEETNAAIEQTEGQVRDLDEMIAAFDVSGRGPTDARSRQRPAPRPARGRAA